MTTKRSRAFTQRTRSGNFVPATRGRQESAPQLIVAIVKATKSEGPRRAAPSVPRILRRLRWANGDEQRRYDVTLVCVVSEAVLEK